MLSGNLTLDPLLGLAEDDTARWNYAYAVGSPVSNPAGLGQAVTLTYSFLAAVPSYYSTDFPGFAPDFRPLTAAEQQAALAALRQVAEVAQVTFVETVGMGQITFGAYDQGFLPNAAAYAYTPGYGNTHDGAGSILSISESDLSGDIWVKADQYEAADFSPGGHGYETLLHELGHALGLKHPFELPLTLPDTLEHDGYTVMSYTDAANHGITEVSGTSFGYSWTTISLEPRTLMPGDILALQYLYGTNPGTRSADDRYSWGQSERFVETLWDAGGTDSIDCANQTLACEIDLTAGSWSSIGVRATLAERRLEIPAFATQAPTPSYDGRDNLAIAYGATIENATGGSADDTLSGNATDNVLTGGMGNDNLNGAAGNDILYGGQGNDLLSAGAGADLLHGGAGTDTAILPGSLSSYSVRTLSQSTHLVSGADGATIMKQVESLQFANGVTQAPADPTVAVDSGLVQIYVAAFGRAPELGGYRYWLNELQSNSPAQLAETIFSLSVVKAIYPDGLANVDFVTAIYANVFGRDPDAEGLAYWAGTLSTGRTRGTLVRDMASAALGTPEGTSGKLYFENRLDLATYGVSSQLSLERELAPQNLSTLTDSVGEGTATLIAAVNTLDGWLA